MAFDLLAHSEDALPLAFVSQGSRIIVRKGDIERMPRYGGDFAQYLKDSDADAVCFVFPFEFVKQQIALNGGAHQVSTPTNQSRYLAFFQITAFGSRRKVTIPFHKNEVTVAQGHREVSNRAHADLWSNLSAAITGIAV
jgi:hypothetical protein